MSHEAMRDAAARVVVDPRFRDAVRSRGASAFDGFDLTDAEIDQLCRLCGGGAEPGAAAPRSVFFDGTLDEPSADESPTGEP